MKPIREHLPNEASPQDHLDDARLLVRLTRDPAAQPKHIRAGFVVTWTEGVAVPLEDAARYATAVAWDEEKEIFHPFVASQRYSQVEWGASGSTLEFAIDVFSNVSADLVVLGLGYAIGKIRGRSRSAPAPPVDAGNAKWHKEMAIEATCQVFHLEEADIKVTRAKLRPGASEFRLRARGSRFVARIGTLDTGDEYVYVERK